MKYVFGYNITNRSFLFSKKKNIQQTNKIYGESKLFDNFLEGEGGGVEEEEEFLSKPTYMLAVKKNKNCSLPFTYRQLNSYSQREKISSISNCN